MTVISTTPTAMVAALAAVVWTAPAVAQDLELPRQKIELVAPPFVHPHEQATIEGPKIMEVRIVAEEKEIVIDDQGTRLQAMTFNGSIPAPLIVAHEGDYVDLTLIGPGEQAVMRWKATRPGVFVYHCIPGGPMIPWHIASGMSGAVMVLPRDGLRDGTGKRLTYDRAYYLGEQDFYVPRDAKGKFK